MRGIDQEFQHKTFLTNKSLALKCAINRKNVEGQIKSMLILEQRYCMPRVLKNYYLLRQLSKEINLGTLIMVQLNNLCQRMNPRPI